MVLTTEAKMSSDIPLPMPRWVMSSPIHINSAVPVTRVSTINRTRGAVKSGISVTLELVSPPPPLWNR